MHILENLEPKKVMYFFEELSKIPRGSSNEEEVSNYIKSFAEERNLEVHQDELFNLIIKKAGTKGKEKNDSVILQGHIDMVCEKNKDTKHDFLKEGIKLQIEGDYITADGTTLGADNGIAVAIAMAVLDSSDLEHPPIEAVFTAQEETGMDGMFALDTNLLTATKMINIDTDTEGIFLTSCAGGGKNKGFLPIAYETVKKDNYVGHTLVVRGLKGGHSGADIHLEKGNANKIAFRVLKSLSSDVDLYVYDTDGGSKDNAIPRECNISFMLNKKDVTKASELIKTLGDTIKKEFEVQDSNLQIEFIESDCVEKVFSKETTNKLSTAITLLPNGVISMSQNIHGLVETSNNVGVVKVIDDEVVITCATRSSSLSKKEDAIDKIRLVYDTLGFKSSFYGNYPAWEYKSESVLRETVKETYSEVFGVEPEFSAIHAGLECGLIAGKMPNLDIIAMGASIIDAHTPDEKVSISSIEKAYKLVVAVLKKL